MAATFITRSNAYWKPTDRAEQGRRAAPSQFYLEAAWDGSFNFLTKKAIMLG